MQKIVAISVSLIIASFVAGTALAQVPKAETTQPLTADDVIQKSKELAAQAASQAKPVKPGGPLKFAGVVEKADGKTVTVKSGWGTRTFDITAANLQGYEDVNAIRPGDSVELLYREQGGRSMASSVVNTWAKSRRPAAAKMPPPKPVPPKPVPATPAPSTPAADPVAK